MILHITCLLLPYYYLIPTKGHFITASLLHTSNYFILSLLLPYYYLITTLLLQLTVSLLHGPCWNWLLHAYFNYNHYYRFSWLHYYLLLPLLPFCITLTCRCWTPVPVPLLGYAYKPSILLYNRGLLLLLMLRGNWFYIDAELDQLGRLLCAKSKFCFQVQNEFSELRIIALRVCTFGPWISTLFRTTPVLPQSTHVLILTNLSRKCCL